MSVTIADAILALNPKAEFKYLDDEPKSKAKSYVIEPLYTQSIQTFSNMLENLINS